MDTKSFWDLSSLIATERIVIEAVNMKANVGSLTIYVRNIGSPAIIIDNVFISSTSTFLYKYDHTQLTTDFTSVVQGDLITISISNLGFVPVNGKTYTIQVYTTRGVSDTYQSTA